MVVLFLEKGIDSDPEEPFCQVQFIQSKSSIMNASENHSTTIHLEAEDIAKLIAIQGSNQGLRSILCTLARRGIAFRQNHPERARAILRTLSTYPFYKGGQFLFDLMDWEDFILNEPLPEIVLTDLLETLPPSIYNFFNALENYLNPTTYENLIPPQLDEQNLRFSEIQIILPENSFYLYEDIVLGYLTYRKKETIDPGHTGDWKTDVFEDGLIKIEHSYWGKRDKGDGYVKGVIKFFNVGKYPLKEIQVLLDLDDTGLSWDAYLCDSRGISLEVGVVSFSDLAPGESDEQKYWWGIKHLFGPTEGDFEVRFNLMPQFKLEYINAYLSLGRVVDEL